MTELLLPHDAPTSARAWVDAVDADLTCVASVVVARDVRRIDLAMPEGSALRFLPGQYLTLRLDLEHGPVERCYTITSAPSPDADRVSIVVKRIPGGAASGWIHENVHVGDVVRARGPLGRFTPDLGSGRRHLYLTAGSGITPGLAALRTAALSQERNDIAFVHCARTPEDVIERPELARLALLPGVGMLLLCEDDSPHERWEGRRGRLDLAALLEHVPDLLEREIFTCGPPAFMAAVRELLALLQVAPERCHEESFDVGTAATAGPEVTEPPHAATTHRVEFRRSGVVVDCEESTTLLAAAARAGLSLASSCGEGFCGTCRTTKLSGDVDMHHAGGIRPREVAEGAILLCCSTPCTPTVLDA